MKTEFELLGEQSLESLSTSDISVYVCALTASPVIMIPPAISTLSGMASVSM